MAAPCVACVCVCVCARVSVCVLLHGRVMRPISVYLSLRVPFADTVSVLVSPSVFVTVRLRLCPCLSLCPRLAMWQGAVVHVRARLRSGAR